MLIAKRIVGWEFIAADVVSIESIGGVRAVEERHKGLRLF